MQAGLDRGLIDLAVALRRSTSTKAVLAAADRVVDLAPAPVPARLAAPGTDPAGETVAGWLRSDSANSVNSRPVSCSQL